VSSRLEHTSSGHICAVVITTPLLKLEVGHRFVVLGDLIDHAGKFKFLGEPTGRAPLPEETRLPRTGTARANGSAHPEQVRVRALELVDAGASQAQAGAKVGVPRTTVQLWLRQRTVNPSRQGCGRESA
jgi:Homeodomain-like domain-containing protein